jgi:hypothetical protein
VDDAIANMTVTNDVNLTKTRVVQSFRPPYGNTNRRVNNFVIDTLGLRVVRRLVVIRDSRPSVLSSCPCASTRASSPQQPHPFSLASRSCGASIPWIGNFLRPAALLAR